MNFVSLTKAIGQLLLSVQSIVKGHMKQLIKTSFSIIDKTIINTNRKKKFFFTKVASVIWNTKKKKERYFKETNCLL